MDFDWQFDSPGYDAGNLQQYEDLYQPQQSFDWEQFGDQAGASMSDALRSADSPYYSSTPGMSDMASPKQSVMSTEAGPQVGQGGMGGQSEDDWKKLLAKGGMGIGTSIAGAGLSAALKAMQGEPKQQSTPMPPSPTAPGAYQTAPAIPLPGTKASPLISGRPNQINMTQGLVNDRIKRGGSAGGFSMY